jgi:uncharacterized membrane protein YkoI
MNELRNEDGTPVKTITVHMQDQEGTIQVDAFTGIITTDPGDRPDWSEGFAAAHLQTRLTWYEQRLGPDFAKTLADENPIDAQDLDWTGIDTETDAEMTFPANAEYRQARVAELLGIDTNVDLDSDEDVVDIADQLSAQGYEVLAHAEGTATGEAYRLAVEKAAKDHGVETVEDVELSTTKTATGS